MDKEEYIAIAIKNFVKKQYGAGELNNPCWNIEALAEHIAKSLTKRKK